MTLTYAEWKTDVTGRQVGDGQCVALAADYVTRVVGSSYISTMNGTAHAGYAIASWDSGQAPAGMSRIPANDAQQGDVLFWNGFSPLTPFTMLSHVAIADGPVLGVAVPVVSQNSPRPVAVQQTLPALGLAGAWRFDSTPQSKAGTWDPKQGIGKPKPSDANSLLPGWDGFISSVAGINGDFAKLNDPKLWQRVGLYALGIALLLVAFAAAFKDSPTAQAVSKGLK